jgi:hypothetical protein
VVLLTVGAVLVIAVVWTLVVALVAAGRLRHVRADLERAASSRVADRHSLHQQLVHDRGVVASAHSLLRQPGPRLISWLPVVGRNVRAETEVASASTSAIEGGIAGEPMFGSLAVNARAGLGSPYPRPLQAGDELQTKTASGAPEQRIELPAVTDAPIRVVWGPQDDEFADETKKLFVDSEWKISATSDRMGYRLEGPVLRHLHGHNIVSDGTVNGSLQVPGNGQPIVLMPDRGTSGGYPKIATVISADFGRFAQIPAGHAFRFRAVSMMEAQVEARKFAELLRTLPERLRSIESVDLNIDALHDANVAGHAVSAVDAGTWHAVTLADIAGPD